MSNHWEYTALAEPERCADSASIRDILRLGETHGYSALDPVTGAVTGMRLGGLQAVAFIGLDDAVTHLASEGGLLVLWKGVVDIQLTFDPHGRQAATSTRALHLPDTPTFSAISVGLDAHHLHFAQHPEESRAVASDVQGIFEQLCALVDTPYGYAMDEEAFEALSANMSLQRDVRAGQLPPVLFWLQYLGAHYIAQTGLEAFAEMGAHVRNLPCGATAAFFTHPWEVDLERLRALNARWVRVRHTGR